MPRFSDYIVYVDESGDHGLSSIDPNYPVFVLVFCVFTTAAYASLAAPALLNFKFKYFGHDQVILHEADIKKARHAFRILQNVSLRAVFLNDLNTLVHGAPFTLIASAIHKERLQARDALPENPYDIAVQVGLGRVYRHLLDAGCTNGETYFVFEGRGKKEDAQLELSFLRACAANRVAGTFPFRIQIADKKSNSTGLQIADLIARPIGRHILKPNQPNRAYQTIRGKFRRSPEGEIQGWGLDVIP